MASYGKEFLIEDWLQSYKVNVVRDLERVVWHGMTLSSQMKAEKGVMAAEDGATLYAIHFKAIDHEITMSSIRGYIKAAGSDKAAVQYQLEYFALSNVYFGLRSSLDYLKRYCVQALVAESIQRLFLQAVVQTSVLRVIDRLSQKYFISNFPILDAYQQAFTEFIKLTENFIHSYEYRNNYGGVEFLMYIERFLFKRLHGWHLRHNLQRKYDRNAKEGEPKYKSIKQAIQLEGRRDIVCGKPDKHLRDLAVLDFSDMVGIVRRSGERQAQCLELHYGQGMKVSEIAEKLEISEGAVKNRLFDARQQLKRWEIRGEIS